MVQSVTTSSNNLPLPDSSRIRNGKVRSLQIRRAGSATLYDINGATLAADSVVAGAHLIVNNANGFNIAPIPLQTLQRDYNNPEPMRVKWLNIDPTQCRIVLNTAASGYSATAVIELLWELECDECGFVEN